MWFVSIVEKFIFRIEIILFAGLSLLFMNSCKIDEFKWNELGTKESWSTEFVVPLFSGDLEFRDFITDWYNFNDKSTFNEPQTTLKFKNAYYREIPTRMIFEPAVIIDSFPLLIQGDYEMDSIAMEFDITNASPYPLNLELQFFNKLDNSVLGPPVVPESFNSGNINGDAIEPAKTINYVSSVQIQSFNDANFVRFISWFDQNNYVKDTLLAYYPIEISIILWGEIKGKNED